MLSFSLPFPDCHIDFAWGKHRQGEGETRRTRKSRWQPEARLDSFSRRNSRRPEVIRIQTLRGGLWPKGRAARESSDALSWCEAGRGASAIARSSFRNFICCNLWQRLLKVKCHVTVPHMSLVVIHVIIFFIAFVTTDIPRSLADLFVPIRYSVQV